jgi:hypothetical protein
MSNAEERLARQIKTARDLAEANRYADRVIARAKAHARRKGEREPRSTGRMTPPPPDVGAIRAACVKRADGTGELCGYPLAERGPVDMCHLDGGSGKRRQNASVRNCLMEHRICHLGPGGLDRAPLAWLPKVKEWAERHGYPLPERFRKLEALRGAEVSR